MELGNYLTINQLYSKYIFAQDMKYIEKTEAGTSYKVPQVRKIMISFDEISKGNFKYQIQQPITENIASRIKLEFIDNRSLSPVDMGGR